MTTTLAPHRVKVLTLGDGRAALVNAESYQPVTDDGPLPSVAAAEAEAERRGWHVVNPRPADWAD